MLALMNISCLASIAIWDMGPIRKEDAERSARSFLEMAGLSRSLERGYSNYEWSGEHVFKFGGDGIRTVGGEASVRVDSWTGVVTSFTNERRKFENHKGQRKSVKRSIENVSTATKVGLDWASRVKLPRSARNPVGIRFSRRSTVYVGFEERPHGYRFISGSPYFASVEVDTIDGALVTFHKDPPRVVESWKLGIKAESLRPKAIAEYRKAMARTGEKKINIANSVKVGYVGNREKNEKVDPGKGRRTLYYRLGVVFSFAKSPDGMFKDAVMFDAGNGKFLGASLYQRPPRSPSIG